MQAHPELYTESNTLLLRGLRGRSETDLLALVRAVLGQDTHSEPDEGSTSTTTPHPHAPLQLVRVLPRCDVALLVCRTAAQARALKQRCTHEQLRYTKPVDEHTLQHHILAVPQLERNFLLSPPPSPPQDWQPIEEDINHVPHLDLQPQRVDGKTVLLQGSDTTPSIIGDW